MLELDDIVCGYGLVAAVHGISLGVAAGSVTALLGPNGAGKTSTVMAVAGHVRVMRGRIRFAGEDITALPPRHRTRRGIGLVPEGRRIFPDLTVAENLLVGGYARPAGEAAASEAQVTELFPRLKERWRQRAGTLSGGEQQMLAIGRALMSAPKLLLIDELSLGLMPAMVDTCFAALATLKARGITMLLVEQNTRRALEFCDDVVILSSGRVVYQGRGAEAREDPDLVDSFLGLREMAP